MERRSICTSKFLSKHVGNIRVPFQKELPKPCIQIKVNEMSSRGTLSQIIDATSAQSQAPMPKRCHNCKSADHLIEDCPTLPKDKKREKAPAAPAAPAAAAATAPAAATVATKPTAAAAKDTAAAAEPKSNGKS